ncbi:MAG: FMN-binding protein [Actinobacteria bacterium]|uniref:Unannotated protein n=1 Tax=freshwater metagenome TaxID=449393 RepID=A0A6J6HZ18_9ZZZZ|nr:FMN-binding protein [Actinomycetota bacterium]
MRQTTKAIISIASIGLIAASYKFGLEAPAAFANADAIAQAQNPNQATGQPNASPSTPTEPGQTPATPVTPAKPDTPNQPAAKPTTPAEPSGGSGSTGSGSGSGSGSTGSGSTGSGTGNTGSTGSGSNTGTTTPVEVTKTGTSIRYRFGTIQVSVTKTDGKITAVNLLQAGATGGRSQAFDFLVQYTVDAQGSSFGNISGATYTTDAYKQSLDAALAQF